MSAARSQAPRSGGAQVVAVVALGGALGALARHGLTTLLPTPGGGFPWAMLLVNVSGCLLIGVLMVVVDGYASHRLLRPLVGVGLLGGYTSFSSYTEDTQELLLAGRPGPAVVYLFGTLVAALLAVAVAMTVTRAVLRPPAERDQR